MPTDTFDSTTATAESTLSSGLDQLVTYALNDLGLKGKVSSPDLEAGTKAAAAINALIVEAAHATDAASDGHFSTDDVRAINSYIRANHLEEFTALHGDDEDGEETGFHLIQNDGASTPYRGKNLVNTVADGIYHIGFEIQGDNFVNEDGNANASVQQVAEWLNQLWVDHSTTGSNLDRITDTIIADQGLDGKISDSDISAGAEAANGMNKILLQAIEATDALSVGPISVDDIRAINTYIRENHLEEWNNLHGDDEKGEETGFHLVQNDGSCTRMFGENFVNTVADGIYHLGYEIQDDRFLNEDGDANATLSDVADWLNYYLYDQGDTETGLDRLVEVIKTDRGLARNTSAEDIIGGAAAANGLNQILVEAIERTDVASDKVISVEDVKAINTYIRDNHLERWLELHGDDENGEETGFHLVQNDGGREKYRGDAFINTVIDGIYHLGFAIEGDNVLNEDGDRNANLGDLATWLNNFYLGEENTFGTEEKDYIHTLNVDEKIWARGGNDTVRADAGDDQVWGGDGDDYLDGGEGNDQLHGEDGNDTLSGREGHDVLNAGEGNNKLWGHEGDDVLNAGDGEDYMDGGDGDDRLWAAGGEDKLYGGDGNDTLGGGAGNDYLDGGSGKDKLWAGTGDDKLSGREGNDTLGGGAGNDYLYGGSGNDKLLAGAGNDYLDGGDGDDKLWGDGGDDKLSGRDGNDILGGGNGNDYLDGGDGDDKLWGDGGDDKLSGRDGNDILGGGSGNDHLYGGENNDQLHDGTGSDYLDGGNGDDLLTGISDATSDSFVGREGADIFRFIVKDEGIGEDAILDFNREAGDRIVIDGRGVEYAVDVISDGRHVVNLHDASGKSLGQINVKGQLSIDDISGSASAYKVEAVARKELPKSGAEQNRLDQIVEVMGEDLGLKGRVSDIDLAGGLDAAASINKMIIEAAEATGVAQDGIFTEADVRTINNHIRANHLDEFTALHGDDEDGEETGFHLIQNDGATSRYRDNNLVNTLADGIYHIGFEIHGDNFVNEDGDANASVKQVAEWLTQFHTDHSTTQTGLDRITDLIMADGGLDKRISDTDIAGGADAANSMNGILKEAIEATDATAGGRIEVDDVRNINAYIRAYYKEEWDALHGDDEKDGEETGFHLVQNDGAHTGMFGKNFVNTVADGIYHLGYEIQGDRILNEDGNPNAYLTDLADWLNFFYINEANTNTGLDDLVDAIKRDTGLSCRTSASDIIGGAAAANGLNQILVEAIERTDVASDKVISVEDVKAINTYIRDNHLERWLELHGDDENGEETGFHLVQNDGGREKYRGDAFINTVIDGIYHLGFAIEGDNVLNEDGDRNANLGDLATWLNNFYLGEENTFGSDGEDHIRTLNVDEKIWARGGNDSVRADAGDDQVWGGDGDDYLDGGEGNDQLHGEDGNDTLSGREGHDVLNAGEGNNKLWGHEGDDVLNAGDGEDYMDGGDGDDRLWAAGGEDKLYGGDGNDTLGGGAGNDYLDGGSGKDKLWAGTGDDKLSGREGNDTLSGGAGNDYLYGGSGNDKLWAGAGNDYLDGGDGDDKLGGWGGDDILSGRSGNDILNGGDGNNKLWGHEDDDVLNTGSGVDYLDGGDGNDKLSAGAGDDKLIGQNGNDILEGGDGNDTLYGGSGTDALDGGSGADYLDGGDGNDKLLAGAGNDTLSGRDGDDILEGGEGDDTLYGGSGADQFLFIAEKPGIGNDVIRDFSSENGDQLIIGGPNVSYELNEVGYKRSLISLQDSDANDLGSIYVYGEIADNDISFIVDTVDDVDNADDIAGAQRTDFVEIA